MAERVKLIYAADFETITTSPTRVWAWCAQNIETNVLEYGNSIESFMEFVSRETCTCYFHNLKFDGSFILYYLLKLGFQCTDEKLDTGCVKVLISDTGQWYQMKVKFAESSVTFKDSLKIIPFAIADMPKAFGLTIQKLEMDYNEYREEGHILTKDEKDYISNDVKILTQSLRYMFEMGQRKLTTGSNALNEFKDLLKDKEDYNSIFPPMNLNIEEDCRKSYKGGWTYVNPIYREMECGNGVVFDVNSMYPYIMMEKDLPYGEPIYYKGKYEYDPLYPLYIQCLEARIVLKRDKYPSIQLKHSIYFNETEYIIDSEGPVLLHLTSVDYELLMENYYIEDCKYICGYKFKSRNDIFRSYIEKWYEVKTNAKKEHNPSMATLAKLMLNSLYGKFGSNPRLRHKIPYYDEDEDIIRYNVSEEEIRNIGYVPVASFITSYARDKIIRAANKCGDRFLYADTDSLHVLGNEPVEIELDDYKLGAFKVESRFNRAKYVRSKCYVEEYDGNLDVKCAGLPKVARSKVTFDNLAVGSVFTGKLVPKVVPGGTILVERPFQIKG